MWRLINVRKAMKQSAPSPPPSLGEASQSRGFVSLPNSLAIKPDIKIKCKKASEIKVGPYLMKQLRNKTFRNQWSSNASNIIKNLSLFMKGENNPLTN
jgi:hypothetical protein